MRAPLLLCALLACLIAASFPPGALGSGLWGALTSSLIKSLLPGVATPGNAGAETALESSPVVTPELINAVNQARGGLGGKRGGGKVPVRKRRSVSGLFKVPPGTPSKGGKWAKGR